ncbi:hypothetical protein [Salipiger abyssi]|uniref:Uncharacterized protein n=1 Tax=Salipiger abyssi TaxID=1250539 RepID=A0A1P8UWI2_9RHOB|nr:hypothetical protein [Salipiger abyssi]APZ53749.1 hypothetical protein Ga0080574_TMP3415 [Salipiger abyssi]
MPEWPADIPFFTSKSGYRHSGPDGHILRSDMDVGPAKRRRRTSAAPEPFAGKIDRLSQAQLAAFKAFYRVALADGVLSFDATDPLTGETRRYAFDGPYQVGAHSNKVDATLSANLEILP